MKNKLVYRGIVFLTIVLFIGASVIPSMGVNVVKRNVTQEYETTFTTLGSRGYIQDLIDNASDGDTIYIPSGTYYENIVINKSISLVGEDKDTTIIDDSYIGDVVTIYADWVNISGFTIQNSSYYGWAGIKILSNHSTITGNTITNNGYGIHLAYSGGNNIITNNTIMSNSYNGIYLDFSNDNNITGNTITNNGDGVILISSSDNDITGNNIISNYNDGIILNGHIGSCNDNTITANKISNNNIGIHLYRYHLAGGCNENTIIDNNISNNGNGIYISDSRGNTITGNTMVGDGISIYGSELEYWNTHVIDTSNTVNGKPVVYWKNQIGGTIPAGAGQVILANCINVVVENQNINGGDVGIELGFSYGCNIIGNTASNNEYGISLYNSYGNNITSNNINSNNNYGIHLLVSNDNNITGNTITNNEDGVILFSSSDNDITGNNIISNYNDGIILNGDFGSCNDNTITANKISYNNNGIHFLVSNSNIIAGNNISNNNGDGIHLGHSRNNIIIGNNISNNGYGINLWRSSGNNITGNMMVDDGIFIQGDMLEHWNTHIIDTSNTANGKPVIYWKNQIGGTIPSGAGQVILANCTNVVVENQNISNCDVGIELGFSSGCTITDSTISNNGDGIFLGISGGNIITGNNIISNYDRGIYIGSSGGNNITGNNILNNGNGIYFYYSNDNNIYHNNLINNEQNAHDFHRNMWYDAELQEGNYWSDYTGIDFNGDGIGDIPYNIPGGSNQDLYPFMEPNGWSYELHKAFIIGKITNLSSIGKYITFESVKIRVITFKPFDFHKYVSGEKLILSKDYLGLIGVRYIFALCEITIRF